MTTTAAILALHQRRSQGMVHGAPDTCACGQRVFPDDVDYMEFAMRGEDPPDIAARRDEAFASHQAEMVLGLTRKAEG